MGSSASTIEQISGDPSKRASIATLQIAKMKLLLVAATVVVTALLAADSSDALFLGQGGVFNSKEAQQSFNSRHTRDMHTDTLTHDVRSHRVKRAKFFLPLKKGLGKGPLLVGPIIIPIIPALIAAG